MAKVRGIVNAGDVIVTSGKQDGTGIAVPVDVLTQLDQSQIVGRAWASSNDPGLKKIMVAVGLDYTDLAMTQIRQLQAEVASLQQELQQYRHLASLQQELQQYKQLAMEVAELKREIAQNSNLLAAHNR